MTMKINLSSIPQELLAQTRELLPILKVTEADDGISLTASSAEKLTEDYQTPNAI